MYNITKRRTQWSDFDGIIDLLNKRKSTNSTKKTIVKADTIHTNLRMILYVPRYISYTYLTENRSIVGVLILEKEFIIDLQYNAFRIVTMIITNDQDLKSIVEKKMTNDIDILVRKEKPNMSWIKTDLNISPQQNHFGSFKQFVLFDGAK